MKTLLCLATASIITPLLMLVPFSCVFLLITGGPLWLSLMLMVMFLVVYFIVFRAVYRKAHLIFDQRKLYEKVQKEIM